jgi:hypothetical protein
MTITETVTKLQSLNDQRNLYLRAMRNLVNEQGPPITMEMTFSLENGNELYGVRTSEMDERYREEVHTAIKAALSIITTDIERKMKNLGSQILAWEDNEESGQ